ncbi:MAG: twin-arginine translocase subunit TatC [Terriglobia bacterium]
MEIPDEPRGAETPSADSVPTQHEPPTEHVSGEVLTSSPETTTEYQETRSYGDAWSGHTEAPSPGGSGSPPAPPDPPATEQDDEDGMARMSFMEHLEELRKRLLLALGGVAVAFILSLTFSSQLWLIVVSPGIDALKHLHVNPPTFKLISPMDVFQITWMKLPLLCSVFISSPWILYQVWAFISPGLYKKEKRWATPFVLSSAGLFLLGGFFAYFVVFRFGLEFLMGLGIGQGVDPAVNVTEYYDLFVEVMLGVGVVFEIPVLIFLLTLIHVASPKFLIAHSRYAILAIVVLAAVVTPTGDVFNLTLFATPMIILFYVGIFASYILVLHREKRRFPWGTFFKGLIIVIAVLGLIAYLVGRYYGYHFVPRFPLFVR